MVIHYLIFFIGIVIILTIEVYSVPLNPIVSFELVSPNSSEYVNTVDIRQFHVSGEVNVGLECLSTLPIKIIFSGIMANNIEYTEMEWNSNLYNVSIGFKSTPQATGHYSCVNADENENEFKSTIYIFADDGKSDPFLLQQNGNERDAIEIQEFKNDNTIVIPCLTFRPSITPQLFSISPLNKNGSIIPGDKYSYNATEGFIVDIRQYAKLTTFKCELNSSSSIKFKIPAARFKIDTFGGVQEVDNTIYWYLNKSRFSVECSGISQVTITIEKERFKNSISSEGIKINMFPYDHIVELTFDDIEKNKHFYNGSYITCTRPGYYDVSFNRFIAIEPPHYRASFSTKEFLNFDNETNQLYYCSKISSESPMLTLTRCNNLATCEIVRRFHPKTHNIYPYSSRKGSVADVYTKNKLRIDKDNVCAIVQLSPSNKKLRMVHCYLTNKSKSPVFSLLFFIGFNSNIVKEGNYKTISDVLRITTSRSTFYVGETVIFTCEASIFVFTKGLEMNFNYNNILGVNKSRNKHLRHFFESRDDYKITLRESIFIGSKDVESIECGALKWNKKQWEKVSLNIEVKESQTPVISSYTYLNNTANDSIINIDFSVNDRYKNITCSSTGIPLPKLEWARIESLRTMNIFRLSSSISVQEFKSEDSVNSTIVFTDLLDLNEGYYICEAKSSIGETNMTFMVTFTKNDTANNKTTFKRNFQDRDNKGKNESLFEQHPWIQYAIGAVVLILLLFIVVIALLCKTLKSKQCEIENLSKVEIEDFMNGNEDIAKKYRELHEIAQYLPYKQEYEIHPSKIDIKNEILGSGNYGMVMKAILEKSGRKFPVAVKTVKSGTDISHLRSLLSEIKIMMYIGRHPHIIEMVGAITKDLQDGKLFVAVEFCSKGSLQSYLRLCRTVFQNQIVDDEIKILQEKRIKMKRQSRFLGIDTAITNANVKRRSRNSVQPLSLTTINLITWCHQISNGMEYLADKKVIHGDLATRNVLITDSLSVKITDFGLARHMYDYSDYVTKQKTDALPWRWLSIEAIKDCKFSTESDIWAYGVTLWEIFSLGEIPYQGFSWGEEFSRELCRGYRLGKPQYATDDLHNTMLECWNTATKDRPSFKDISNNLKELMERVQTDVEDTEGITKLQNVTRSATIPEIFMFSEI